LSPPAATAAASRAPVRPSLLAGVPAPILGAVAAAWAVAVAAEASGVANSLHHDALLEGGPGFGPALLLFLLAWQVMVAAMMLPSSLPMVRMFAVASANAPDRGRALAAFTVGYAAVWSAVGLLAFGGDAALHAAVAASPWLHQHDWAIAPSVLLLAGAFQFTPLKDACLRACRHPASFLRRHYRRGPGGGFMLGARHGVFCVGCCWALMLVMFAAGAASLIWMAALTGVMVHEKTRLSGEQTVPLTGVILLAAGSTLMLWAAYANGVV
jgi:predicted metal-binding membrane protein